MNKKLTAKVQSATKRHKTAILRDGNFTVALLLGKGNRIVSFGVSKRNPSEDKDIPERGKEIALARAVKKVTK